MRFKYITIFSLTFILLLVGCGSKSDADLQKEASTAVIDKASGASVTVKSGVATITGFGTGKEVMEAGRVVAAIEGINDVKNEMWIDDSRKENIFDEARKEVKKLREAKEKNGESKP